ncbi:MAG: hypothetical protein Q8J69_07640 [Sphingobacteriaceae bacterium]|nr:hypothetical protein [Sphingobacteriaceae bacterium]
MNIKLQPSDLPRAERLLNQVDTLLSLQKEFFSASSIAKRSNTPEARANAKSLLSTSKELERITRDELNQMKGLQA